MGDFAFPPLFDIRSSLFGSIDLVHTLVHIGFVKAAKQYNIHEAKTQFSKLVERAGCGEEITISKAGIPVVRLVPVAKQAKRRFPGTAGGRVKMKSNFEAPLPKRIRKLFLS